jgi:competence protein ComEC
VEAIDLVVLTHPDADHIGGLSGLARRVPIRQVAVPAWFRRHPDLLAELKEARISTQRVLWLSGDWKLAGPGFTLEIRLPKRMTDDSDNEGSPFLRVHLKGMAAVLTGDAGEETELTMMGRADWRAAILKAGHHGSAGSSGEAWLRRVSPQVVVVSCGAGNRFGHPAPAAMERFVRVGASVLRTDRDGDVHFEPWGEGYRRVLD